MEEKCTLRAEPSPGETNMVTAAAAELNIAPAGTSAMPPCTNHIILHPEHGEVIYTSQTAPHPPLGRITHANVRCFDTVLNRSKMYFEEYSATSGRICEIKEFRTWR